MSTGSISKNVRFSTDGPFIVPANPVPASAPQPQTATVSKTRQVKIAPAPSPPSNKKHANTGSIAEKNSFLANLLKGTGAQYPVKEEPSATPVTSLFKQNSVTTTSVTMALASGITYSMSAANSSLSDYHHQHKLLSTTSINGSSVSGVNTLRTADILDASFLRDSDSSDPASPAFKVPSPADSAESGNRSRHASNASNASNDSFGSAVSPYRDEVCTKYDCCVEEHEIWLKVVWW